MDFFAKLAINKEWRIDLYEVLAERLDNGITLKESLQKLYERSRERKPKSSQTMLLKSMIDKLESGDLMSDALAAYVPEAERMLIAAGETSGTLVKDLGLVIELIKVNSLLRSKIAKGVTSPLLMIGLVYAFFIWMGVSLIPKFEKTSNPANWHGLAAQMRAVASFSTSYWSVLFPVILAAIALVIYLRLPYGTGKLRIMLDKIPPWSFYKLLQGGGWLMSFASLVSAGMTHETALTMISDNAKPWLRVRLETTIRQMGEGGNVGGALRAAGYGFPSEDVIDALDDYSELNNFEHALMNTANKWIAKGLKSMDQMMVLVQSALAIVLIGSNLWLVYGINAVTSAVSHVAHIS